MTLQLSEKQAKQGARTVRDVIDPPLVLGILELFGFLSSTKEEKWEDLSCLCRKTTEGVVQLCAGRIRRRRTRPEAEDEAVDTDEDDAQDRS
jgi:hypothetical protein